MAQGAGNTQKGKRSWRWMAFDFIAYGVDICVCVWRERHSIVNILDDDSDTMEMMR